MALQLKMKQGAEVALMGYRRQGFAVDPRNPEHLQAYTVMRQLHQRISPQAFMDHLKGQVKEISSGAKILMPMRAAAQGSSGPRAVRATNGRGAASASRTSIVREVPRRLLRAPRAPRSSRRPRNRASAASAGRL